MKEGSDQTSENIRDSLNLQVKIKFRRDPVPRDYEPIPESGESRRRREGFSWCVAAIFIVADMAGSGLLAMPAAIAGAGWGGVVLLLVCCGVTLYAGVCLGRCWSILEERYEEYREKNRYPYPAIAERAYGLKIRYLVSLCIDVNLFGVATVFLLLSSQFVSFLTAPWGVSFCSWILILAALLCPLMWLATPNDFWLAAVLALSATLVACIILLVLLAEQLPPAQGVTYPPPTLKSFFLSYGTMLFAFGAAPSFPTYQNDMRNRNEFTLAAVLGFLVLLFLYLPVGVLAYVAYGGSLRQDVLTSLPPSVAKWTASVLMALSMSLAFLLVINAPLQDIEEFLRIPNRFGWKRCVVRVCVLLASVFVAQSLPKFGKVLNLVGGSTTCLASTVLPCLFYYKLCSQRNHSWTIRFIPRYERIALILIVVCGVIGGCISTYSAVLDIVRPDIFSPPCYVNASTACAF